MLHDHYIVISVLKVNLVWPQTQAICPSSDVRPDSQYQYLTFSPTSLILQWFQAFYSEKYLVWKALVTIWILFQRNSMIYAYIWKDLCHMAITFPFAVYLSQWKWWLTVYGTLYFWKEWWCCQLIQNMNEFCSHEWIEKKPTHPCICCNFLSTNFYAIDLNSWFICTMIRF